MVSFWSGDCSRAVCRRRVSAGRGPTAPSRALPHSTNPIERLHAEVKRRTNVVGIFPNSERKSRSVGPGTDTGHDRTTPLPSTSVRSVPKSSSRTAMRSTITHGKRRYQPLVGPQSDGDDDSDVADSTA